MRKLSANALLLFGGDAVARALGFFTTVHLARALGAESFGLVTIGLSILSYALWFSDLGLTTLGTREMARPADAREHPPADILATRLILSIVVLLAMQAVTFLLYPDPSARWVSALYLLSVPAFALSLEWYFQGAQRFLPFALSRFITAAVYFIAVMTGVSGPADAPRVPIFSLLGTLAAALLLLAIRRDERLVPAGFSWERMAGVLRRAAPIGVGGIFAQTVQLLPPLALGLLATNADAGVLGAAMKVIFVVLVIDRVFAAMFLPAVAKLFAAEAERSRGHLERALAFIIVLGFGIGTLITVHAANILRIIYNESYQGGALALGIMSWFAAATLVNSIFSYGLIGAGAERSYLRATVSGGTIAAVLTFALTWWWGLTGAAVAMVGGELAIVTLTYVEFRRRIRLRFARPLAVSAALAAALIILADRFGPHDLWGAPILGALFLLMAYLLGAIRRDDILWLMKR